MKKKANAIANKYGLDADDGGGGNTNKYSNATLRKAGNQYMKLWNQHSKLENFNEQQAKKYADQQIIKKYGNTALSDVEYYNVKKGQRALAITLGVVGGLAYLGLRGEM